MIRRIMLLFSGGVFLLASPVWAYKGIAVIKGTHVESDITGTVQLEETKKGLNISIQLENVPPGDHGFHIHQYGNCDNNGKNAGGHYNPKGTPHGFLPKNGLRKAHAGDLGNITIGEDGSGKLDIFMPGLTLLKGKYSVAGRAFILHAKPDDFGQPTGNAGGRIGCGPIIISGE